MNIQEAREKLAVGDAHIDAAANQRPLHDMFLALVAKMDEAIKKAGINPADPEDPVVMLRQRAEDITESIMNGKCQTPTDVQKLKAEYEMLDEFTRELIRKS